MVNTMRPIKSYVLHWDAIFSFGEGEGSVFICYLLPPATDMWIIVFVTAVHIQSNLILQHSTANTPNAFIVYDGLE